MNSKLYIGQIVTVNHFGDDLKEYMHPFLIVDISKKNIYGIQGTSVKVNTNKCYFCSNNQTTVIGNLFNQSECFSLDFFNDLEYETHFRKKSFEKISYDAIKSYHEIINKYDFIKAINILKTMTWLNTGFFNHNEIIKHLDNGLIKYRSEWIFKN